MHRRGTDEEFKRIVHYLLHMLTEVCCFHCTRHLAIFYESCGCKNVAFQKTTYDWESCHNSVPTREAAGPDIAPANTAAAVANDQTHFLILQLLMCKCCVCGFSCSCYRSHYCLYSASVIPNPHGCSCTVNTMSVMIQNAANATADTNSCYWSESSFDSPAVDPKAEERLQL